MSLKVVKFFVNSTQIEEVDIKELYDDLISRIKAQKVVSCYEYNETDKLEFMKPFIDIDLEVNKLSQDDNIVIEKTINTLKKLFGDDAEIVYSTDHRNYIKEGEKKTKSKQSFHFVVANKKVNPRQLNKYMKQNLNEFTYPIDTKVFRDGISKFRLPLTRKEKDGRTNEKKFMKINGGDTLENFKKFCLSYTENLPEYNLTIKKEEEKKEEIKEVEIDKTEILDKVKFAKLDYDEIEPILKNYTITKSILKDNVYIYFSLDGNNNCGIEHDNNHQYLKLDILDNSLWLCCHSEKCKGKDKLILENVFIDLLEFDYSTFINLPRNYGVMKKYFEKRIIFLSDLNDYKQIKYDEDNEITLTEISFLKIAKVMVDITNDKGEVNQVPYGVLYDNDVDKKIFKDVVFYPKKQLNKHYSKYYNEFRGLGYERILAEYEDKEQIYKDYKEKLDYYLRFISKYVCQDDEKILHFFLSLLSSYIKYPEQLSHMILVLYSNEQGTGKSSFLDFFFKVIGKSYCVNAEIEQITEKHSNLSYKKIINVIEELEYDKTKNNAKVLKNKCQALSLTLNEKCEKMRTIRNFVHYIITTNNHKSLPLPPNDRRHYILEFTKLYDKDDLISSIEELYEDKNFIYSFGRFLKEYREDWDFSSPKNWERNRPLTQIFRLMIKRDGIEKFFTRLIDYDYHNSKNVKEDYYFSQYVEATLQHFILSDANEIMIGKHNFYELYCDKNDNEIKTQEINFYEQLEKIKKFCYSKIVDDEEMFVLDIEKIKNHLKLKEDDLKLPKILKIIQTKNKEQKLMREEINDILKR